MSGPVLDAGAREQLAAWRSVGDRIVFTNGVFDLLHCGHVEYLEDARALGDRLVVGVNSDASVRRLKGPARPLVEQAERAELLEALESVDLVAIFDDDTPLALIEQVLPEVLAKGGDWALDQIVGRQVVERHGGEVVRIRLREGMSTTTIIERILAGRSALGG
jgi:rfaE bifunctional protein nucleotidyltransferase chain/domain